MNLQVQYIPHLGSEPQRGRRKSDSSASSSSTTANGRRIIPIYNLHTHNHSLIANTIHDAGTDDRVAKFHKHGIEVANVGIFAPIEVWGESSLDVSEAALATASNKQTAASYVEIPLFSTEIVNEPPKKRLNRFFHSKSPTPPPEETTPTKLPLVLHPEYSLVPVLGTTPSLKSRTTPPQGRAVIYSWSCKKWCKEVEESWLSQTFNFGSEKCDVDIRFEWSRAQSKKDPLGPSRKSSLANLQVEGETEIPPVPPLAAEYVRARTPTLSGSESQPVTASPKVSTSSSGIVADDVDTDSDPEDSEVPWVCVVLVNPSQPPSSNNSSPNLYRESGQTLRFKVASLAPAPHHPKVVAQLKIQYPLPDVDLTKAMIYPRPDVPAEPGSQPQGRHILSAEDIKDVICSSALWVVVREGFAGLTKRAKSNSSQK